MIFLINCGETICWKSVSIVGRVSILLSPGEVYRKYWKTMASGDLVAMIIIGQPSRDVLWHGEKNQNADILKV